LEQEISLEWRLPWQTGGRALLFGLDHGLSWRCYSICELVLGVKYRKVNAEGEFVGGPMYYLAEGIKSPWLGISFAVFAIFASLQSVTLHRSTLSYFLYLNGAQPFSLWDLSRCFGRYSNARRHSTHRKNLLHL